MASGVAWDEDYASPTADVAQAGAYNGPQLIGYLSKLPKVAEPGERFNYNTGETNLAGELLRERDAARLRTHRTLRGMIPKV